MSGPPEATTGNEADRRPSVGRHRRDLSIWLFGGGAVIGAVLLFNALDGHRRDGAAPSTALRTVDNQDLASAALPPLYIPPEPVPPPPPPFIPELVVGTPTPPPTSAPVTRVTPMAPPAPVAPSGPFSPSAVSPQPVYLPALESMRETQVAPGGRVLIFDGTASAAGGDAGTALAAAAGAPSSGGAPTADTAQRSGRIGSTRLGQLANTVPQGTLIPAVLETALDSTRPGHVRALVSRDVRGFDGSRVLIPRGTRLFGEYLADLSPGQNRAFVRWTRLVRPDGVAVDLDSPAADALGRAGIQGRVNSHFLERFSQALLQSTLSIGMALAGQELGNAPVIVALPGATQSLTTPGGSRQVQPTLRVEAGVSVTVFVAQDLTLPGIGARR